MKNFGFNISLRVMPEKIKEFGEKLLGSGLFNAIEVNYYDNMRGIDISEYNKAIKNVIDKYNPRVYLHAADFNLAEENENICNAVIKEIENTIIYLAEYLGGKDLILHSGKVLGGLHVPIEVSNFNRIEERSTYLSIQTMQRVCDIAQKYNVTVYTENLTPNWGVISLAKEVVDYVKKVDRDNLKIVYDVGHSNVNGQNVYNEIMLIKDNLAHLHIHNNDGKNDQHKPLDCGNIDFYSYCKALDEIGYDETYMFELRNPDISSAIKGREYLLSFNN
ncbi:sugar phosphate isomerase/epimerase family protein [Vallitalea guaymasensis]|uniref:sugar phosphate isomerase/epimerase family protein n=1 Tax=Vallitalea guaymasensis TaxID=1185412 RepID=UPI0023541175|nr:sugar phosphate isomerase/epimerase family protein [Vallitalea guaymasensis]